MVYMDTSDISWFTEMGLDTSIFMEQCDFMDSLDDEVAAVLGQDLENCFSAGNNSSPSSTLINMGPSTTSIASLCAAPESPPAKLHKPNNCSNFPTLPDRANNNSSTTPIILNFGIATDQVNPGGRVLNPDEEAAVSEVLRLPPEDQPKRAPKKTGRIRPPSQTYDHIIAERKRREQLSQRFVALSTIVPGLKKMDKTSVLGDAIKYLKQLQERVKVLEEQATKQTMESVVLVKKSQITADDDDDGSSSCTSDEQSLPEIEARVCGNQILLRLHCQKHKGVLVNLLTKVENLNLAVVNTNVTPFGTFALEITIVAEMDKEFDLTVREVVKRLRGALLLNNA